MNPRELLKIENQFCFAAYAVSRAVMQAYEPLLADLDLTYPQYLAMLVLWERDDITLKDLGDKLRLDSGTLTPLLKRLEGKGLLTRSRSKTDERALEIVLTAAGKRLRQKALKVPENLVCRLNTPLVRVIKLRDDLNELLRAMEQQGDTV